MQKTLAMFVILDFLPPKIALQMQALSHRMYDSILPQYLYWCTIAEDKTSSQTLGSNFLNFSEDSDNYSQLVIMAPASQFDTDLSWKVQGRVVVWDPEFARHVQADRDNFSRYKTHLKAFRGFKFVYSNQKGSKIYVCGGILSEEKSESESKGFHIGTSPCFEIQAGGRRILRRANMTT
mmetsp:Transcript_33569/g.51629  ORF Transcript_33569/g.51629 Transcript_33569/m.51629 type:complete len:179 (-) Transcript_33569:126-662(-)